MDQGTAQVHSSPFNLGKRALYITASNMITSTLAFLEQYPTCYNMKYCIILSSIFDLIKRRLGLEWFFDNHLLKQPNVAMTTKVQ